MVLFTQSASEYVRKTNHDLQLAIRRPKTLVVLTGTLQNMISAQVSLSGREKERKKCCDGESWYRRNLFLSPLTDEGTCPAGALADMT